MTIEPKRPDGADTAALPNPQQQIADAANAAALPENQKAAETAQDSGVADVIGNVVDVVDLGSSVVSSIFDIFS